MSIPDYDRLERDSRVILTYIALSLTAVCAYLGWKAWGKWQEIGASMEQKKQMRINRKKENSLNEVQNGDGETKTPSVSQSLSAPSAPLIHDVPDIEDFAKSLVPSTMKQLKREGTKPYTKEERVEKIAELNNLTKPNFMSQVLKSGKKLSRVSTVVFQGEYLLPVMRRPSLGRTLKQC